MKLKNIITGRIFNVNPDMYKSLVNSGNIKNFEEITEITKEFEEIKKEGGTGFGNKLKIKDGKPNLISVDENGDEIEEITIPKNGIYKEQVLDKEDFKLNENPKFTKEELEDFEKQRLELKKTNDYFRKIDGEDITQNEISDNETEMDNQIGDFEEKSDEIKIEDNTNLDLSKIEKEQNEILEKLETKNEIKTKRGPYKKKA